MAEVLVKVAFGIPCDEPAVFVGLSRLTLFQGRIMVHYSLFFQISILLFSAVSTCDSLVLSPSLQADLKGGCGEEMPFMVQASHSCILTFHFFFSIA